MKKLLFPILFLILMIFLVFSVSGCFGAIKMKSLSFYVNDGAILPQYYSESKLELVPNYDDRTLAVAFSQVYPYRTAETAVEDFSTEGIIGGEYFDRYEQIVDFILKYEMPAKSKASLTEVQRVFLVNLENLRGEKYSIETLWEESDSDIETLRAFYLEVKTLLLESAPV